MADSSLTHPRNTVRAEQIEAPGSIQDLLATATQQLTASSESAALDAEVLLCHCLNKNRSFLRAWPEHHPTTEQRDQYRRLIEQRLNGTPVAYLTGQREFWSRNFTVSSDVLIPRPDTELLIELSLELLPTERPCKIIDLGTGSGIIAITLAAERPLAAVIATDISVAALAIAQHNADRLSTSNVCFRQSHWFNDIKETGFDLVVSNPPYIADNDPHLRQGDVRFEPDSALLSAENGLQDIRLITKQSRLRLKDGGQLMVEHGYNQQAEVQAIFNEFGYRHISTHADLSGNPRVTSGLWKPL